MSRSIYKTLAEVEDNALPAVEMIAIAELMGIYGKNMLVWCGCCAHWEPNARGCTVPWHNVDYEHRTGFEEENKVACMYWVPK